MKGYRINAGELAHRHWLLASVFSANGTYKLELLETAIGFTVTIKPVAEPSKAVQHCYPLEAYLEKRGAPKGVYSATHEVLLGARRETYLAAATFFQEQVASHGVQYPSPSKGELIDGKWQAQLKSQVRGSPFLALALTDDQSGEVWVTVQDGVAWQRNSAKPLPDVAHIAHRLRSYGRLTVKLTREGDHLVVKELSPAGSAKTRFQDLPESLRARLSLVTLH